MNKNILGSLIAVFAVLMLVQGVSALTNNIELDIRGVRVEPTTSQAGATQIGAFAGETIPLRISFVANEKADDVSVTAWIAGYRNEISSSTERFYLINNSMYTAGLSLRLPADIDTLNEDLTINVRLENGVSSYEQHYTVKLQRESYKIEILSVETASKVAAGTVMSVNVVLKNRGLYDVEDAFVTAKIPALGVEKKIYLGDLTPADSQTNSDDDAAEKVLYLLLPADAKSGVYDLEVKAFDADSEDSVVKTIVVEESETKSEVVPIVSTKEVSANGEATFSVMIVNPSDALKLYTIVPAESLDLNVKVSEPIVSVGPDSSKTVEITVSPTSSVKGTRVFSVDVLSNGQLVKKVTLSANVTGSNGFASNTVILTVILAIIFVVLLVVLIVLLTRKPAKAEELSESYY